MNAQGTPTPAVRSPAQALEQSVIGAAGQPSQRILCVDDEPHVLAALRRLFKGIGYTVLTAESAAIGLQILAQETVDLVIADMRMPEMDGAHFLSLVREGWPQTMRILLTGQADAESIAKAVNSGEIYRYFTKPWDNDDIVLQIRLALERGAFELERSGMERLALARAEELKALNASLEQNVSAGNDELAQANQQLKNNFVVSLKVFASLIEARGKKMVGHARRVADLARKLASRLELEPALVHEVFVAGLLHDVGKLGFLDELLETPVASMNARQLQLYRKHPARAEQLLMPLQDLRGAAASIGAQLERFDGTGFPRQLRGRAILVGARILAVCSDYDNLQIGLLAPRLLSPQEALGIVERYAGHRYDPWVVNAFSDLMHGAPANAKGERQTTVPRGIGSTEPDDDLLIDSAELVVGMVLSRDLISPSGLMMLSCGHAIDKRLIAKVQDFEKTDNRKLTIHVRKPDPT